MVGGGDPSFFAVAFSDERVTVGRIQGGTEAGPESRAGDGQAGPGACGSPVADVADVAATRGGVGGGGRRWAGS